MNATSILESGYRAIRNSVALSHEEDLRCFQLEGSDALDVLEAVCPCDVFLLDGQMKHTVLLEDSGVPFADVYVGREGKKVYLVGYGASTEYIVSWLTKHSVGRDDFSIINLNESHRSYALNGPYSWELSAELIGPDIIGLPYLSVYTLRDEIIIRAGRTGEYGYHLLIPAEKEAQRIVEIEEVGKQYDLEWASTDARDQCVLENFFFDINREGTHDLTPLELQLQWRLSTQKDAYPGAEAIQSLKQSGWNHRLTCFISIEPVFQGEEVTYEGKKIGSVVAAGYSPLRGAHVGKALMQRPYWHAGLNAFKVGDKPIQTISAPAVNNLSLKVSPYRHSYHTREEDFS